ncbi:unnamed protein product [Leuciscus chuanchicus]
MKALAKEIPRLSEEPLLAEWDTFKQRVRSPNLKMKSLEETFLWLVSEDVRDIYPSLSLAAAIALTAPVQTVDVKTALRNRLKDQHLDVCCKVAVYGPHQDEIDYRDLFRIFIEDCGEEVVFSTQKPRISTPQTNKELNHKSRAVFPTVTPFRNNHMKYSALDTGESNPSMSSSGEDSGDINTGVEVDGPSDSPAGEDVVTLILTPVDLPSEPSYTFQPPIKKRILEKSKSNYELPPEAITHIPPCIAPPTKAQTAIGRLTSECTALIKDTAHQTPSHSAQPDTAQHLETTGQDEVNLWELLDNDASNARRNKSATSDATIEVQRYMTDPPLQRSADPLAYWGRKRQRCAGSLALAGVLTHDVFASPVPEMSISVIVWPVFERDVFFLIGEIFVVQ